MPSRSRSARSSASPSPLYRHFIKLLFFVLTFLVFVALQNSLVYLDQLWGLLQREVTGIPWWIICLAAIGTLPLFWIIFLGIDQFMIRLSGRNRDDYETLSSDSESEDTSDIEAGRRFQKKYSKEPANKKLQSPSQGSSRSSQSSPGNGGRPGQGPSGPHGGSHGGGNYGGAQRATGRPQDGEGNSDDSQNPTDVDVTVHPVDTTIAAGGESRVSPTYNVSLMSFSNENPQGAGCPYDGGRAYPPIYPSAPAMMQGGPAYFKRNF